MDADDRSTPPSQTDRHIGRRSFLAGAAALSAGALVVRSPAVAGAASAGTGPGDATADLSRRHLLRWDGPVLSVVGGKLTTYRAMGGEAVDAVVARLGRSAPRSCTARLPLVGAAPRVALDRVEAPVRLVARYGTEAPAVATLGTEPVVDGRPETVG